MSDLEDRLARLEARADIEALVVRYFLACDGDDVAQLRRSFAANATFSTSGQIAATGLDAILDYLVDARSHMGLTVHTPNYVLLEDLQADRARGLVGAHLELVLGGVSLFGAVRYVDDYIRVDGAWVFARRDMRTIYIGPWAEVGIALESDGPVRWPGIAPLPSDYPRKQ